MKQTAVYKLSQWEKPDRIQMEDFNSDNARIEAALKAHEDSLESMKTHAATLKNHEAALAALNTAVSKRGNCQLQFITYKGTNGGTASNPKTLTFAYKPMAIFLFNSSNQFIWATRGATYVALGFDSSSPVSITWNDRSISWYGVRESTGMDNPNYTYYALVLMDISATS
ncbi:hypothetical protein [Oscillibacter sp. 1-3]|uniref:hypothetical protein n=1 Tax=Oscillibacter sp. 1-3 TaxID=1235797 RepID=UPI000339839A|nr:hypothetical protein [Oscillibacter sp. 1-3]EOS66664.1 hypothetical protein C816_00810 [Oscillibacter sp. 1-3]MCI9511641.1 hypothetical protein [Oscillibacter sp.]